MFNSSICWEVNRIHFILNTKVWSPQKTKSSWRQQYRKNPTGHFRLKTSPKLPCCLVVQSCLTLYDPMDCSQPVSSVHGIFQGKNNEVGCHFLLQGIFLIQGSNPHPASLLHCKWVLSFFFFFLYHWATGGAPKILKCAISHVTAI